MLKYTCIYITYAEDTDVIGEINLMERVNGRPHVR
jgi:hypothetical protein